METKKIVVSKDIDGCISAINEKYWPGDNEVEKAISIISLINEESVKAMKIIETIQSCLAPDDFTLFEVLINDLVLAGIEIGKKLGGDK